MLRSNKNIQLNNFKISQNFLTSKRLIEKLIRKADINKNDHVLEIGAGKGHITRALSEKAGKVTAYEIDGKLYSAFKEKAASFDNLSLYHTDFLKCVLPCGEYKVFANIPFSITTEIIRKLTDGKNIPSDSWLIMEKGAAKRFSAQSSLLKPFFNLEITHHFNRNDFHPMPGVDVVMLHINRKTSPDIDYKNKVLYEKFIKHSCKHGLFGKNALLTKKQIGTALRLENLPEIGPSGDTLYIQWLCLFRCWLKFGKKL